MSDFKEILKEKTAQADEIIGKFLPEEEGLQKIIFEAMNYSVRAGGKRVRPILMLETFKAFGGEGQVVEPFMAALEMIHTYSLVHDDLPCMDNDEFRRGLPTTWSKFGEDMGVLCGDSLLGFAFETALKGMEYAEDKNAFFEALKVLANKSGCYGMLGGQVVDVMLTGKQMTEEQMEFVYRLKTSALIECAMDIGAILAGADKEALDMVNSCAYSVGMAFQIKDDILDIVGDQAILGKPINSDEKNNKVTYASLHGIEKAEEEVASLMSSAQNALNDFPGDTSFLKLYFEALVYRIK